MNWPRCKVSVVAVSRITSKASPAWAVKGVAVAQGGITPGTPGEGLGGNGLFQVSGGRNNLKPECWKGLKWN